MVKLLFNFTKGIIIARNVVNSTTKISMLIVLSYPKEESISE